MVVASARQRPNHLGGLPLLVVGQFEVDVGVLVAERPTYQIGADEDALINLKDLAFATIVEES